MIIDVRVLARYGLSVLSISVYQNKLSPFRTIYIIVYVFLSDPAVAAYAPPNRCNIIICMYADECRMRKRQSDIIVN